MGTRLVSNSFSTAFSTAFPSVDSRSHFRISRRAMVTVTSVRSRSSWVKCSAAPSAATRPASDTTACNGSSWSNSGMGSFHKCLCKSRVLPAQFGVVYLLTANARVLLLMMASTNSGMGSFHKCLCKSRVFASPIRSSVLVNC